MLKNSILGIVVLGLTLVSCGGGSEEGGKEKQNENKPTVNNQATTIPSTGLKIAYVYMDTINLKYKLIPIIENEIAAKSKEIEKNLESLQRRALKWEQDWQKKGGPMSTEQDQYMQEAQQWQMKLQQAQQDAQITLGQIQTQKMAQAQTRMNYIMQQYADEQGFDFILSYQLGGQIHAVNPAYNVTTQILERLNADVDSGSSPSEEASN